MEILIKKLKSEASIPSRGSEYAAGYDLRACTTSSVEIMPGETVMIGTGLSVAIPAGYFGAIFARSGLASKQGLRPANCVGVIDSDYRGELIVALHNDSEQKREIENGERIAQLVIIPFLETEFRIAESLPDSERGENGFGSTGVS